MPRLLSGLLAGLAGRNIQQKQSFLADKKGQKIASDRLTLIDDPLIVGGLGSGFFDGDGFAARRRIMIEAGVLKEFYIDSYYSRKLGCEPTTGGSIRATAPRASCSPTSSSPAREPVALGVCRAWDKSQERARDFVARQSAATDKLLKPPRGGGRSKEKSDFRSAKRCLRSLSRQISVAAVYDRRTGSAACLGGHRQVSQFPTLGSIVFHVSRHFACFRG